MKLPLLFSISVYFLGIKQSLSQACGKPVYNSRIVGGADSQDGSWPWQVGILRNSYFICGGALISSNWVITAAHCYNNSFSADSYKALLGWYQLRSRSPHAEWVNVKQVIVHANYSNQTLENDIVLMELNQSVTFTNYILPVCLPSSSVQFPDGVMCWVTGWGNIKTGELLPDPMTLQEVEVPIISRSVCDCLYHIDNSVKQNHPIIPTTSMCAGYTLGQKDSCQGDSGGPLVCKQGDTWTLAGIVSFGGGCAEPNHPGVYTQIAAFQTWLQGKVAGLAFNTFNLTSSPSVVNSICEYQNGVAVKRQDNFVLVNMTTPSSTSNTISTAVLLEITNAVSKTSNVLTTSSTKQDSRDTNIPRNDVQNVNFNKNSTVLSGSMKNVFSLLNTIACTITGFLLVHSKK
ncbi:serine protease 27-like [Protopterus annectens]|uniref:serine protease 27-like n=1 Tax=Protopterus annectens TaxID=7888 RepID=UPI001CFAF6C9|nr:serine protease 27-like [Protopterus annectens]